MTLTRHASGGGNRKGSWTDECDAAAQRRGAAAGRDRRRSAVGDARPRAALVVLNEQQQQEGKTCRKRFTSFQALGGHRTRHTRLQARMLSDPPAAAQQPKDRGRTSAPFAGSSSPCARRSAGTEARRRRSAGGSRPCRTLPQPPTAPCCHRPAPVVFSEAVGEQEMVTTRRNKGEFKMELTWNTDQSACLRWNSHGTRIIALV
jgi:hypothetical protein